MNTNNFTSAIDHAVSAAASSTFDPKGKKPARDLFPSRLFFPLNSSSAKSLEITLTRKALVTGHVPFAEKVHYQT